MPPESGSTWPLAAIQAVNILAVISATWAVPSAFGFSVVSDPLLTIRVLLAILSPLILLQLSTAPLRRPSLPRWRCIVRGVGAWVAGTAVAALTAVCFGAPTSKESLSATLHWSSLLSLLTVVPPACVLGFAAEKWRRVIISLRAVGVGEVAVSVPGFGAVIGAWLGAMPMPLDWEKPWQEWPICCTVGTCTGYAFGSFVVVVMMYIGKVSHTKEK